VVLVYLVIALGAWLGLNLTVFLLLYARSHRVPRKVRFAETKAAPEYDAGAPHILWNNRVGTVLALTTTGENYGRDDP
jgi:hypothetical protein